MRYWWVNQNQTFRHEVAGGYLWSPQRKTDNSRNPFYESMREVAPGDLIFSFADTFIRAIGVARSYCYECPKPVEFGNAGMYWEKVGWRVDVTFRDRPQLIRPREHMDVLAPLLPERYAPLRPNGDGLQSVYLTELPPPFALALAALVGRDVVDLAKGLVATDSSAEIQAEAIPPPALVWESELVRRIEADPQIVATEKEALVMARRGQGLFKARVRAIEHACRITRVDRIEHLRASHCKPWRDSNNEERLDPENGLLLTPSIDHLFDRGFISFESDGRLVVSGVVHKESLRKMGVDTLTPVNVGAFSLGQCKYLEYHREHVLLARGAH
jgi:putative restriction endonuclease